MIKLISHFSICTRLRARRN